MEAPYECSQGAKIDRAIEKSAMYTGGGLVSGGLLYLLSPIKILRFPLLGIAIGMGLGLSVGQMRFDFAHPLLLHGRRVSE